MPYANKGEWNPSLKGIKPSLTNAQANLIASWADKIDSPGAWPIAISQFKKSHRVRGGAWVARMKEFAEAATLKTKVQRLIRDAEDILDDRDVPSAMRQSISVVRAELKRAWAELKDQAGAEESEMPQKAIIETAKPITDEAVSSNVISDKLTVKEDYMGDAPVMAEPVWGATSFADLDAANEAKHSAHEAQERVCQLTNIINNILLDVTIENKPIALKKVTDEFIELMSEIFTAPSMESESAPKPNLKEGEVLLAESAEGAIIELEEGGIPVTDKRAPLHLEVRLIKPGMGNKKDMNFYPAAILQRDAHVFEGAKMYTTDHNGNEKSERTEVSVIEKITGFDKDGAPIARVAVFDPVFAEKTRNRATLGQLNSLECSILAAGTAKKGKTTDGIDANIVESILSVSSVDWVTRAGAGGQALNIAETEGGTMSENTNVTNTVVQPVVVTPPVVQPVAPPVVTAEVAAPAAPVFLSEAEVTAELDKMNLPKGAQTLIAIRPFANVAELHEVASKAVEIVKSITASGQPFGLGNTSAPPVEFSEADHEKALAEIDKRYGLGG